MKDRQFEMMVQTRDPGKLSSSKCWQHYYSPAAMNVGRMVSKLAVNRVCGFAWTNPTTCDRRRIPQVLEKRDQRLS
jgi:hypothetical protein